MTVNTTTTKMNEDPHPGAGTLYVHGESVTPTPVTWEEIVKIREEPHYLSTPDVLLEKGIGEYTFLEGRESVLGKGKFSTVYKVIGPDGDHYALKHTPLHPHHPLIAARLLREPTLLAQLPPHPNLIGVRGMKRTEGHFYLIEQYASHHVPLPQHPLPLSPSRAAYILDQLVSVTRDCLHANRVCHRDLKGENVLVDPESGDILILDLGLATQFSASEAKLTTCCGSPAFHSPEIVSALAKPPGVVTYYGPELDIWCIALTLLSLLLRVRYPLGPHHTHHSIMRSRALDRLQELDELYPPKHPWISMPNATHLTQKAREFETREWKRVRKAMWDFLEIDGRKRIRRFGSYEIGEKVRRRVRDFEYDQGHGFGHGHGHGEGGMKSTSFIPTDIKYTLPLYLLPADGEGNGNGNENGEMILDNPTNMKEKKVLSYIRYLLRSSGIGYHCLQHVVAQDSPGYIYQLVLPYPQQSTISKIPSRERETQRDQSPKGGWVASLNPFRKNRSTSVPTQPKSRSASKSKSRSRSRSRSKSRSKTRNSSPATRSKSKFKPNNETKGNKRFLRTWIRISFEETTLSPTSQSNEIFSHTSRSSSRTRVDGLSPMIYHHAQLPLALDLNALSFSSRRPSPSPRRKTSDRVPGIGIRPSPLSRQVSPEPTRQVSRQGSSEVPATVGVGVAGEERQILSRASSSATSARTRVAHRSRVIITSSDIRGYPALRRALDIKHVKGGESDSEYPLSPVVIQKPLPSERNERNERNGDGVEEEEERGRPRSKESQKSLVMLEAIQRNSLTNTNTDTNVNVNVGRIEKDVNEIEIETVVEEKEGEGRGRGNRKIKSKNGFWSLFAGDSDNVSGRGQGTHRSYSMPPSRESLV